MKKVCFVATIPAAIHSFLKDNVLASSEKWEVTIICGPDGAELLGDLDVRTIPLAIERKPSPLKDLHALVGMIVLFRRERFNLIHSITPKTGLLAMLAAWLICAPNRVHTFTGQVWVTKRGWRRYILKLFDKLIVIFATHVFVDSPSQRSFLVSEGVLPQGEGIVIGLGSICGVDSSRFHPDAQIRVSVRTELSINPDEIVILFLGRLNRDKGMLDLASAFSDIASQNIGVVLLLVGAEEDVPFSRIQEICGVHRKRLRRVGFTPEPERYMAAADVFCLPSYREGFGQVIIEAAASGIPTVASRIYGITDAVVDGETGCLFPPGDVNGLTKALLSLINNLNLCRQMGESARLRALKYFSSSLITSETIAFYGKLLDKTGD